MKLALITSGGANFYSIEVALQRLGVSYQLTNDPAVVAAADGVILPGVGSARYAMNKLAEHGLLETLRNYSRPLLGICLGMQLLYEHSEEGDVACLGVIAGQIRKFVAAPGLAVPQMGWNNLTLTTPSRLLAGLSSTNDVYFVHSYYAPLNSATLASCNYSLEFSAVVQQKNFYAMQFHPEKSGLVGAHLLNNFIGIVNDNLPSN